MLADLSEFVLDLASPLPPESDPLLSFLTLDSLAALSSDPETFFFFPDLKSVSYQPLPLKRNPAADIFLRNPFLPQASHIFRGGSLTFCKVSNSWSHLSQTYSKIGISKLKNISRYNRGHDLKKPSKNTVLLQVFLATSALIHYKATRLDPRVSFFTS